jgi:hypothetical protein
VDSIKTTSNYENNVHIFQSFVNKKDETEILFDFLPLHENQSALLIMQFLSGLFFNAW